MPATSQAVVDFTGDVCKPSAVRALLEALDLHPRKALGQNFLVDRNILTHLLDMAGIGPGDTVLEVGPGLGALTGGLLERAARVVAVEKDPRLAAFLRTRYAGRPRLQLIEADMLDLDVATLTGADGVPVVIDRLVANLPYSAGTRILVDVARIPVPPVGIVVTVQKEVADRIAAGPGTSDFGLLAIWLQARYRVADMRLVRPRCFYPAPEVDSTVISLVRTAAAGDVPAGLYALTRQAFGQRRKRVARTLSGPGRPPAAVEAVLRQAGADPDARPEALSVAQWLALAALLSPASGFDSAPHGQ